MEVPEDLSLSLNSNNLLEKFHKLPPSHQREYIKWIEEAKKPETRAKRIQETINRLD